MAVQPGDVLADRFHIVERVGAGGMGVVFRARDAHRDSDVALKLLSDATPDDAHRFVLEGRVLAALEHPAIVRYVAHGQAADGRLYLAMEWLTGEDLARTLARGPLTVAHALRIAEHVAGALGAAHARGIVHRDVKPSNILVCDAECRDVRVVDFGIARAALTARALTRSGAVLGTPAYMAPEQAASGPVGPAADLFALGCVIFECVTGAPAFSGDTVMAILAKILFAEAPRLSSLCPEAPAGLDELVQDLLSKEPEGRPRDALEVVARLQGLGVGAATSVDHTRTIGHLEQRVVSVVAGAVPLSATGETLATPTVGAPATPVVPGSGAHEHVLRDGSLVSVFRGAVASHEALRALRYSLRLRAARPDLAIAVTTGRAVTGSGLATGDAIDRAVRLLADGRAGAVALDEDTAELVGEHAEVTREAGRFEARAVRGGEEGRAPVVLGRRTPCVGRARELAFLRATLEECAEHRAAHVVLVTAPAGLGKSRLRRELLQGLVRDGSAGRAWTARADGSVEADSFGLAAQLVRAAAGLGSHDRGADSAQLGRYLERLFAGDAHAASRAFLAELAGLEPAADVHPWVLAARGDPSLMAGHVADALDSWMDAETRGPPLLVMLEDLHWADAASVEAVDRWIARSRERPLAVLAFSRPDVRERFPDLWTSHDVSEIRLAPLSRGACEALVRQVVPDLNDAALQQVVDAGAGNPLMLEELLRARAAGVTPRPQLAALIEARIDRLPADQRRILRAASVLGERFSELAVAKIAQADTAEVGRALAVAAADELVVRGAAIAGDAASWAFRHALVRDAAYAMLPDSDRVAGHRAAAAWLRETPGYDRATLADHLDRAATHDVGRLGAMHAWIDAAKEADAGGATRMLRRARILVEHTSESLERDAAELELVEHEHFTFMRTDQAAARTAAARWRALAARAGERGALVRALCSHAIAEAACGELDRGRGAIEEAATLAREAAVPEAAATVAKAAGIVASYAGAVESAVEHWREALPIALSGSVPREAAVLAHNIADGLIRLGRLGSALPYLERAESLCREHGLRGLLGLETANSRLRLFLGAMRGEGQRVAELERLAALEDEQQNRWHELETLLFLGMAHANTGDVESARQTFDELSRKAVELGHASLVEEARSASAAIARGERPWFRGGSRSSDADPG
ncbi:MAG: protein kinase [Sandaracinaceae bacterium]|nr:protein kinase [Sandaracinaceae bacterium]